MTTEDLESLGLDLKGKDLKTFLGEGKVFVTQENETEPLHVKICPYLPQLPQNTIIPEKFIPLQPSKLCDYSDNTISADCHNDTKAYGIVQTWEDLQDDIKKDKAGAEDWNNAGCAYIWWNESWTKAVESFEYAKTKTKKPDQQKIIEENLKNANKALASKPIHIQVSVRSFAPLGRVLGTLEPQNVIMNASIGKLLES